MMASESARLLDDDDAEGTTARGVRRRGWWRLFALVVAAAACVATLRATRRGARGDGDGDASNTMNRLEPSSGGALGDVILRPRWRRRIDRRPGSVTFRVHVGCASEAIADVKPGFFDEGVARAVVVRHDRGSGRFFDYRRDGIEMTRVTGALTPEENNTFEVTTDEVNWEYAFALESTTGRVLYEAGTAPPRRGPRRRRAYAPLALLRKKNKENGCIVRHGRYFNRALTMEKKKDAVVEYAFGTCEKTCAMPGLAPSSPAGVALGSVCSTATDAWGMPRNDGTSNKRVWWARAHPVYRPTKIGTAEKLSWEEGIGDGTSVTCAGEYAWLTSRTGRIARTLSNATEGYETASFVYGPRLRSISTNGVRVWGVAVSTARECGTFAESNAHNDNWVTVDCPAGANLVDVGGDYVYLTTTANEAFRTDADGSNAVWTPVGTGFSKVSSNGNLVFAIDSNGYLHKSLESTPGTWSRVESFPFRLSDVDVGPVEALATPLEGEPFDANVWRFPVSEYA